MRIGPELSRAASGRGLQGSKVVMVEQLQHTLRDLCGIQTEIQPETRPHSAFYDYFQKRGREWAGLKQWAGPIRQSIRAHPAAGSTRASLRGEAVKA